MKSDPRILILLLIGLLSTLFCHCTGRDSRTDINIEGVWQGVLAVPGAGSLRIVFNISRNADGTLSATLDSPDQGAASIPTDKVVFKDGILSISVATISGSFKGKVVRDDSAIDGQWKQRTIVLPLKLVRVEKTPGVSRPQTPTEPYPYSEEEVAYENKDAGIKLAGTLTLPRRRGRFAAVVLVSGSGPQDRDEAIFGHRPFLILADHLTRNGIAVLRVDDRGVGGSTGSVSLATSEDLAGDVQAGIDYLRSRRDIDPGKIGIIGHSEGGIIAPMVARSQSDIAFIVLMAGSGLTGEELLYLQNDYMGRAVGKSATEIAANRAIQEQMFAIVKEVADTAVARKKLRKILKDALGKQMGRQTDNYIESQVRSVLSPWFRFFLTYDPAPALQQVKCPTLVLIGENDAQVPPKENLRAIEAALRTGGNDHFQVKEMPGLNHMFQTSGTGSVTDYSRIEETISPVALREISEWILATVGK